MYSDVKMGLIMIGFKKGSGRFVKKKKSERKNNTYFLKKINIFVK